ncbi:MAG: oligosaccharide flippase family protein [bacterium]|nr:oligosaccharide flippase family protein [bacterium]
MTTLTSKAILIAFGSGAAQVLTVLTGVVLARLLSRTDFGTYKQVFLVYQIFTPIFTVGIPAGLFYFLPRIRDLELKKQFISRSISLLIFTAILLTVFIFVSAFWAPRVMHNPKLMIPLMIFSVYAFATVVEQFFQPLLIMYNKLNLLLIYPIVRSTLFFIPTVTLAFLFGGNLQIIFLALSLVSLIFPFFGIIYTKRMVALEKILSFDLSNYKEQLAYGIPLGVTSIIGLIAWEFDKLVVSINFPPELYAVYVVGATEIPFVSLIRSSVNQVVLPEMAKAYSEGNTKRLVEVWHNSIRKISLIILPVFVIAMIFSHEIITLLYSEKFASSVPYFRIYLLLLLIRVASYGIVLQAIGKTRENLKGSIVFFVINAILNPVLVFTLGLAGPAVATVISTFINVFYYVIVIKRYVKISLADVFPWTVVLKILSISILSALPISLILYLNLEVLVKMFLAGTVYSLVYLLLIIKLNALSHLDRQLLSGYVNKILANSLNKFRSRP